MQAQGLDHPGGLLLQAARHGLKGVGGEKLPRVPERCHLVVALLQVPAGDTLPAGVLFCCGADDGLPVAALKEGDHIVGHLVHHMHGAGADVQHDVVAAQFILMDHVSVSLNS